MEGAGPPSLGGRTVEQSSLEPVDDRDRKPRTSAPLTCPGVVPHGWWACLGTEVRDL